MTGGTTHVVSHNNPDAKLSVLVYGWNASNYESSYGYHAGLGFNSGKKSVCYGYNIYLCLFYYLAKETTYTSNSAIQFGNVQCVGNESSLLDCSYNTSLQCPYQRSAVVECLCKKVNSVHACSIVYRFYIP